MAKQYKVGLALGGGAARGLSHIGVVSALRKHQIPIDVITGTSMGAIIGAIFAANPDVEALRTRFDDYLNSEEFANSGFNFFKSLDAQGDGILFEVTRMARRGLFNALMITQTALIKSETAEESYAFLVDDLQIEQTKIPFAVVTLDLLSGKRVVLDRGSLRKAIAASCAMPGVLNPVEHQGQMLVDGGWAEAVPVEAARQLGADFVIAVDVYGAPRVFTSPRNAIDVIARADSLVRVALSEAQLKSADVVLVPKNGVSHWADFSTSGQAVLRGEEEVDQRIDDIRQALKNAQRKNWFRFGKKNPEPASQQAASGQD
jgi:NTE family protein